MTRQITPFSCQGTLCAPLSKSAAHRAMICGALADRPTIIPLLDINEDIRATLNCLKAMGAAYEEGQMQPILTYRANAKLDCACSASTLRFLMPVAAVLGGGCFEGSPELVRRPVAQMCRVLRQKGVKVSGDTLPLLVSGGLSGGDFELPGDVSSQYVSGLLLAFPLTGRDCFIHLTSPLQSEGYADLTLSMLSAFGVRAEKTPDGYFVGKGQAYRSPGLLTPEGDYSGSANFLALAAMTGEITVKGLSPQSLQPDRRILAYLTAYGADVQTNGNQITVKKAHAPRAVDFDASVCPDLSPIIAALALNAEGETRIKNASRLRLKESDRAEGICRMVRAFGGDAEIRGDCLRIRGKVPLHAGTFCSTDHRMVMAASVIAALCEGASRISEDQAVCKSYPLFWQDFDTVGGNSHVIHDGQ